MKTGKPFSKWTEAERERALVLHRICGNIAGHVAGGETLNRSIKRVVKRARYGAFKIKVRRKKRPVKIAGSTLFRWFAVWKKQPSPEIFYRGFKSGPSIPALLVREFTRRCLLVQTPSAAQAYQSLVLDWRAGKRLPGLGTWQTWTRIHARRTEPGKPTPPPFPFSVRTFSRRFTRRDMRALRARREMLAASKERLTEFEREMLAKAMGGAAE